MTNYTLGNAQIVLGERDNLVSQTISEALRTRGVRDLAICRDTEALRLAIASVVDLVVCDVDLPGLNFCDAAQQIRQHIVAGNPFAILIATARPSTIHDISRVMKSGLDDFVVKPMTADLMLRRIGSFANGRKPFVVTNNYIGPSRREGRRDDGSDNNLIEVPNTFRSRVVDHATADQVGALLETAFSAVETQKMKTCLDAIVRLANRARAEHGDQSRARHLRTTLDQLAAKADELMSAQQLMNVSHSAEIAGRLAKLARRIVAAKGGIEQIHMDLIARLAEAIVATSTASAGAVEISRQIGRLLDNYFASSK